MSRRRPPTSDIVKEKRKKFFPHGGGRNSETHWNDHENPLNRRRHHGTDPLKDGYDPGEDPLDPYVEEEPDSDIPI